MEDVTAPRYRLLKPFYVDDNYIEEGVVIEFAGTPNEAMEPLNEPALEKMKAYLATLEGGRTPRPEDVFYVAMANRPKEPQVTIPHAVKDVPQMGNLRPNEPQQARVLDLPATPVRTKKVLGTVVVETPRIGETA